MYREVLDMKNRDAAKALGLTESVYRHHLASARVNMTQHYEGLCSLVNKQGVCYQCSGLREATPERQRGVLPPERLDFEERLNIVRDANFDTGASQAMHDVFWRRTKELEDSGAGCTEPLSDCGQPDEER